MNSPFWYELYMWLLCLQAEMEAQRMADQEDYWLIQYQRLMDRKPQSLIDQVSTASGHQGRHCIAFQMSTLGIFAETLQIHFLAQIHMK